MKTLSTRLFLVSALIGLSFLYYRTSIKAEETLSSRLLGRILLQVENHGEAWYLNPSTGKRHFLGRPADAFALMRKYGVGISESDIKKIRIADFANSGLDTDGDRLIDSLEDAIGTSKTSPDTDNDSYTDYEEIINGFNPIGEGKTIIDESLTKKLSGKILLETQKNGEAWYLNPADKKRYFLGRPVDAFEIMRKTGLGIKNADLAKISANSESASPSGNISASSGGKTYSDPKNSYAFKAPSDWNLKTYSHKAEMVKISNYSKDVVKEKKAAIMVSYINSPVNINLDRFQVASKTGGTKTGSSMMNINGYKSLSETFKYDKIGTEEISTYIQLDDKKMVRVTLFSAGNDQYHESVYRNILESIKTTNGN